MKHNLYVGVFLIALFPGALGLYEPGHNPLDIAPTREPQRPLLLPPISPNAYGPGINSDSTGRPFIWRPEGDKGPLFDPLHQVRPDAYGPGIGMDQYGRPVYPTCPPGMTLC